MSQAAQLPMLLLGEEFQVRQIWQAQLANLGRFATGTRQQGAVVETTERAEGAAESWLGVSGCAAATGLAGLIAYVAGGSNEWLGGAFKQPGSTE